MFSPTKFLIEGITAVKAAMDVVRPFIMGIKNIGNIEVKSADNTLVTMVDRLSEAAATAVLTQAFPDVPLVREEGGLANANPKADWIMWLDPLDGTNAFTIGMPTSTVILMAYDLRRKKQIGAIVGEPISGRVWSATEGSGCNRHVFRMDPLSDYMLGGSKRCNVSTAKGRTVFIDVSHGFPRGKGDQKRQILNEDNMGRLLTSLRKADLRVLLPGSNGLNHALVANGCPGLIGTITTAMGGPWDTPTLLGIEAGGFGRGFRMTENGTLTEADVLDPEAYDMAIVAGTQEGLDFMTQCLDESVC